MKTQFVNLDELVFENKNHSYGAYYLRVNYEKILLKSLTIVLTSLFLLYSIKQLIDNKKEVAVVVPKIETGGGVVTIDPYEPDPVIIEPQVQTPRSICFTVPVVTTNVVDDLPVQDDFHDLNPSTITNTTGPDIVDTATQNMVGIVVPTTIETVVDEVAEYPGGLSGLKNDIATNLNYPAKSLENGISGKVILRFVVDDLGNVKDIEIKRSNVDELCEKEALRVAGIIKQWKPARKNGYNCYSYYFLPIEFKIK